MSDYSEESSTNGDFVSKVDLGHEIEWVDRLVAAMNAVPWIGGVIATWVAQNRQEIVLNRIQSCLLSVVSKLERVDHDLSKIESDDRFAELSVPILEMTARTFSDQKRDCFANMLANAAIRDSVPEREQVYSMAALLDQLDWIHVSTLDRMMRLPYSQSVLLFGAVRTISEVDVRDFTKQEHYALDTLEQLGLIDISDLRERRNQGVGKVIIHSRGLQLHRWVTEPTKE